MSTATLTSKGQVTIPKEVRERLNLATGDRVDFVIEADGSVRLRRLGRSIRDLAGILHRPGMKPVSVEAMHESLIETAAAEDERIRRGG